MEQFDSIEIAVIRSGTLILLVILLVKVVLHELGVSTPSFRKKSRRQTAPRRRKAESPARICR